MLFSEKRLLEQNVRITPRLWIQHLALFDYYSPAAKFQEVEFTLGLNVIVGLDFPNPKQDNDLGGHSVGKSTLCRLIRYCLGEPTFSTNQGQNLIRENFPHGWVGCELYLDGVLWSVLLPFMRGVQAEPRAGENQSLNELFTHEPNQYVQYQKKLESLVPPNASRADVRFAWRHLLAWLMRDQKCIQDNFWDWRTPESESNSPQHRNRKKESEHLVRSVLGLLVNEENKLLEELTAIQEALKQAKDAEKEAMALPELYKEIALQQLRNYDALSGIEDGKPLPELMFNLHLAEEEKKIKALEKEHGDLQANLAAMEHAQKYWRSVREQQQNLLDPQKGYLEGLRQPHKVDPNLTMINAVANDECPAAILYKDCVRVQEVRNLLEQKQRGVDLAAAMSEKDYQRVTAIIAGIENKLQNAQQNEMKAVKAASDLKDNNIPAVYKNLMAAYRRQDDQKRQWETLKRVWAILYFGNQNTEYQKAAQAVRKLEDDQNNKEEALSLARQENTMKGEAVTNIFDDLVKNIINTSCYGKFTAGDDIIFSVQTNGEIDGDALKVMRTVLGDFSSMLYAIDKGLHPGFLVHDSPRQADMSLVWYQRFFTYIMEIAELAGGRDNAPFQYIITTTTAPPPTLHPYIRKELASHPPEKLLFKKRLTPVQSELIE
jgi:hypothetical protein